MKILSLNILFTILIFSFNSNASNLNPFVSDGCTLSPDGTFAKPDLWRDCCVEHDLWFWGGGSKESRVLADKNLKTCIADRSNQLIANLYMLGVQIGKLSPFKLKNKKWGNGWMERASKESYFKLSKEEVNLLLEQLESLEISPLSISRYRSHLLHL